MFADPADHLFLAVTWLVAALPLVAASVLLLRERGASEAVGAEAAKPPTRDAFGSPTRRRGVRLSGGRLAVAATCAALALALLVGVRGETWEGSWGSAWDPTAPLAAGWGAAAALAFAATLMLRTWRRVAAACLIVAVAVGFAGCLLSGSDLGNRTVLVPYIDLWLADPTQRLQLSLVWLVAAVPLVAAAVWVLRSSGTTG